MNCESCREKDEALESRESQWRYRFDYLEAQIAAQAETIAAHRTVLKNLLKALEEELTGLPKNVSKSHWATEWDAAEDILKLPAPSPDVERLKDAVVVAARQGKCRNDSDGEMSSLVSALPKDSPEGK